MGKVIVEPITSEVIRKANARGEATINAPTAVMEARITVLANDYFVSLVFRDGSRLAIPISRIGELANLRQDVLQTITIGNFRDSIHIAEADVDIYVPGLIKELYGRIVATQTGRTGGSVRSKAKSTSSRENGKKGGRPRKDRTTE